MLLLLPEFAVSQQGDARRDVRRLVEFAGDGWTLERKQERLHVGHARAHEECARARYVLWSALVQDMHREKCAPVRYISCVKSAL